METSKQRSPGGSLIEHRDRRFKNERKRKMRKRGDSWGRDLHISGDIKKYDERPPGTIQAGLFMRR